MVYADHNMRRFLSGVVLSIATVSAADALELELTLTGGQTVPATVSDAGITFNYVDANNSLVAGGCAGVSCRPFVDREALYNEFYDNVVAGSEFHDRLNAAFGWCGDSSRCYDFADVNNGYGTCQDLPFGQFDLTFRELSCVARSTAAPNLRKYRNFPPATGSNFPVPRMASSGTNQSLNVLGGRCYVGALADPPPVCGYSEQTWDEIWYTPFGTEWPPNSALTGFVRGDEYGENQFMWVETAHVLAQSSDPSGAVRPFPTNAAQCPPEYSQCVYVPPNSDAVVGDTAVADGVVSGTSTGGDVLGGSGAQSGCNIYTTVCDWTGTVTGGSGGSGGDGGGTVTDGSGTGGTCDPLTTVCEGDGGSGDDGGGTPTIFIPPTPDFATDIDGGNIDVGGLSASGVVGTSGSCPASRTVPVMAGASFTMDFSMACNAAGYIRGFIIFAGALLGFRIAMGGV